MRVRRATSGKSLLIRVIVSTVAITALLLLVLLAAASANTEFFDRYYSWLYSANIIVALVFMLVVLGLVGMIVARLRKGKFGTRLLAKLAVFFTLVGVVPGGIIYIVSCRSCWRRRSRAARTSGAPSSASPRATCRASRGRDSGPR